MFCQETAAAAVERKLDLLQNDKNKARMIMRVKRVGLGAVVDQMCKLRGAMHTQYERTGGYIVREDDLRRVVNDLYSSLRHSDATTKTTRI